MGFLSSTMSAECAEIKTSKLHKSLDRKQMFDTAWWLQYCCCRGVAVGVVGDPYFAAEARTLCIHATCECCNKKLAGGDTGGWKPQLFDHTFVWDQQFWLYYFLCAGVSLHGPGANGRPLLGYVEKQFCVKQAGRCVAPIQEGVFCSGLGTQLCFWSQAQFPPVSKADGNPCIACCGIKMNKGEGAKGAGFMGYGKPSQNEMK